ncbi:nucleotide-binding protein [Methanofollis formosanus]|uniref:Nucleotide-binding protein n=1 Tax=Methanofollis formosanus TaxID=299308 RepID=A0A8G1EGU2_9EURY|nr:nucleotide-binding protein [Methanofollis formosanus]QYZ79501.1 nucleotide-binding protein [Methanofollis formosanus]
MDLSEASERISQKFKSQSVEVDAAAIEKKLRILVEQFGVNLAEAEKTVIENIAKEHGLESIPRQNAEQREIGSLLPGEWATIEAKVVGLSKPFSPTISQTGILADATGAIQFTAWARANAPLLQEGQSYRIESAVVDDYRGVPKLNFHAGTTITLLDENVAAIPQMTRVADLRPGVASMRVKMVQEWEARHDRIFQTGLVGDESGTIKFTIWKDDDATALETGTVYNIFYAAVSEFQGRLSITLNEAKCFPDEEGEIEVGTGGATYQGAIITIGPGSGVIKRCPVEGCNRVLSRMNYCPVHEMQSGFRYDLRIKGVLDDGEKAHNILMQREVVEAATGLTLEEAVETVESSPMGLDDVLYRLKDTMMGRYFTCTGNDLGETVLIKGCAPVTFDPDRHAELLNRLGGEADAE